MANNIMQKILKIKAEGRGDTELDAIPEIKIIEQYLALIYKSTLPQVVMKSKSRSPPPKNQEVKVEIKSIRP